jgi:hypothetical protein
MRKKCQFWLRYRGAEAPWLEPASLLRNRRWYDRRLGSLEHGATDPPKRRHRRRAANKKGLGEATYAIYLVGESKRGKFRGQTLRIWEFLRPRLGFPVPCVRASQKGKKAIRPASGVRVFQTWENNCPIATLLACNKQTSSGMRDYRGFFPCVWDILARLLGREWFWKVKIWCDRA